MAKKHAEAGRRGPNVRSDCFVSITLKKRGSLDLDVRGKLKRLYGQSIQADVYSILDFYDIKSAKVLVEDAGALPFNLKARVECAVRRLGDEFDRPYLTDSQPISDYETGRERFRRSRLYLPGNESKFMINAGLHQPDGIILDLEDSVSHTEKDAARILVRNALQEVDFYGSEKMVRINQLPDGLNDLDEIIPCHVHSILISKCESAQQVRDVDSWIEQIKCEHGINRTIYLMPIVESALGVLRAYDIATASSNIVALTSGLEDFTADIGAERTQEGKESFMARSMVIIAARAAGIQPIEAVYSDVQNEEGLRQSTLESKSLGYEGRGCIHPRQIKVIHECFAPKDYEIQKAQEIVAALKEAEATGSGVVSLGSKMIDPPVVKRAQRIIQMAEKLGLMVTS